MFQKGPAKLYIRRQMRLGRSWIFEMLNALPNTSRKNNSSTASRIEMVRHGPIGRDEASHRPTHSSYPMRIKLEIDVFQRWLLQVQKGLWQVRKNFFCSRKDAKTWQLGPESAQLRAFRWSNFCRSSASVYSQYFIHESDFHSSLRFNGITEFKWTNI